MKKFPSGRYKSIIPATGIEAIYISDKSGESWRCPILLWAIKEELEDGTHYSSVVGFVASYDSVDEAEASHSFQCYSEIGDEETNDHVADLIRTIKARLAKKEAAEC